MLEETRKQIPAWESERAARQEQFNECGRLLKKLAEADEQKTAVKAAEKAYQNAQTAAKTQADLEKQCHVQYQENAEKIESGESIHEIMAALNEQKHQKCGGDGEMSAADGQLQIICDCCQVLSDTGGPLPNSPADGGSEKADL